MSDNNNNSNENTKEYFLKNAKLKDISEEKDNTFIVDIDTITYKISLEINNEESLLHIIVNKYLYPITYKESYTLEQLWDRKDSKVFRLYDNLNEVLNVFLIPKINNLEFFIIEDTKNKAINLNIFADINKKQQTIKFNLPFETYDKDKLIHILSVNLSENANEMYRLKNDIKELKLQISNNDNDDLVKYYKDSKILRNIEWNTIKEYINNKEIKLLYKSSIHGCSAKDFHYNVDNKGPTITFIKNVNGDRFGGYTSVDWNIDKDSYIEDESSFVFSLNSLKKYTVTSEKKGDAIFSSKDYNAVFGENTIRISNNFNENLSVAEKEEHYKIGKNEFLTRVEKFYVSEVETYSVC